MTVFEYIAVLVSIIIGLGITHLLGGVGRLIGNPGRAKPYWIHLVWGVYMFQFLVFWWWWQFRLATVADWTYHLYLFLILYAVLLYLLCVVLFPREFPADFSEYYYERRRWFFGLLIITFVVDVVDTLFKGMDYFANLGLQYPVGVVVFVALFILAMVSRSPLFHGAFGVGACLYQFSWIARLFGTLS
jgi:hypothetical protein